MSKQSMEWAGQPAPAEMSKPEFNRYTIYLMIRADEPLLAIEIEARKLGLNESDLEQVFDLAVLDDWKFNQRPFPLRRRPKGRVRKVGAA